MGSFVTEFAIGPCSDQSMFARKIAYIMQSIIIYIQNVLLATKFLAN